MADTKDARSNELKDALQALKDMGVPEHLQDTALKHLLAQAKTAAGPTAVSSTGTGQRNSTPSATAEGLREFIGSMKLSGAVTEIPALFYWAKHHEGKEELNERDVVELYRRANIRPPKNVAQSFRDLATSRYLRLESVKGNKGHYRLSRTGEDFVLYDLNQSNGK